MFACALKREIVSFASFSFCKEKRKDAIKPYENNAKLHPLEQSSASTRKSRPRNFWFFEKFARAFFYDSKKSLQWEQIKRSIQEFGNNDPIAIDENGVIIEGHGRYEALKQLGFDEIEIIRLSHLNEQQKKAYILAHNKLTMNTGFDFDVLNLELDNIIDFDMTDFGFELAEEAPNLCDSFIDDLLEKELGQREIEQDSFKMTLIFPLEYKTAAEGYLASNGKQKLIELCLTEMGVGWCRNAEHSVIYATCRCVSTTIAVAPTRAVTALLGTESTFLKFLKKKLQRR